MFKEYFTTFKDIQYLRNYKQFNRSGEMIIRDYSLLSLIYDKIYKILREDNFHLDDYDFIVTNDKYKHNEINKAIFRYSSTCLAMTNREPHTINKIFIDISII